MFIKKIRVDAKVGLLNFKGLVHSLSLFFFFLTLLSCEKSKFANENKKNIAPENSLKLSNRPNNFRFKLDSSSSNQGYRAAQTEDTKRKRGSNHPCKDVRLACQDAGFVLNDNLKGNKLIADCMIPLAEGASVRSTRTGRAVVLPSSVRPRECAPYIKQGNKS